MALAYEYMGELDKAQEYINNALWLNPTYDKAWYNLGLLSLRRGDREQFSTAHDQLKRLNTSLAGELLSAAPR
jgi:tetratricopeptide (TPR) repeat protein